MATKKKPGAKKPAAKRKKRVSGTPSATLVVAGKKFTKTSCHTTKTAAKAAADGIRKRGNNARVVKNGAVTCVYKGAKTSSKAPAAILRRRRAA